MISNRKGEVSYIGLSLFIIILLFLALLIKHIMLKREIKNVTNQMKMLADGSTEKMLDLSLIDSDLEQLAGVLNQYNEKQRYNVACALQHEERLKESVANISHDLRTPLTVILGHLQLLQRLDLTDEQAKRVNIVLNKADRMNALVGSFYEISILDSDQACSQKEKLNLCNMLMDLITDNAPVLDSKNIQPEIILPDYSVFIISDRSIVDRIFQNLFTNAIRYSVGFIRISLSQTDKDGIVFCIENTVQNVKELDEKRMFERFYTGDASRNSKGTGLGLAVVKLLADKLGCRISAKLHSNILEIKVFFRTPLSTPESQSIRKI